MSAVPDNPEASEVLPKSGHPSVVDICAALIRCDTSNFGAAGSKGELSAAIYLADLLTGGGYRPTVLASAPGRANVLLRVPGTEPDLPGILVHGHLDVVPVEADQWSVDPFGGVVRDGYLYGRGATDMKDAVAVAASVLLGWSASGRRPRRDLVVAFVADEEEDGAYGAGWLVDEHPEWFDGVGVAIGESGGCAVQQHDSSGRSRTFYPIATGERGTFHLTLRAEGTAGHASRGGESAVLRLAEAVARVARYPWPADPPVDGRRFLSAVTDALGIAADLGSADGIDAAIGAIGEPLAGFVRPSSRNSSTPTVLRAGYKINVVPGSAEADVDVRAVPDREDEVLAIIDSLLGPGVTRVPLRTRPGLAAPIDSPWFSAMAAAITAHDPSGVVVPFCMGGGTDAKSFHTLGIPCYGFTPLSADPEGRDGAGMHGVDERVPIASLIGGVAILDTFLTTV
jgi:acetylornithine deacetylase/succinyl-diaminopimelate desuccinylase-like protein